MKHSRLFFCGIIALHQHREYGLDYVKNIHTLSSKKKKADHIFVHKPPLANDLKCKNGSNNSWTDEQMRIALHILRISCTVINADMKNATVFDLGIVRCRALTRNRCGELFLCWNRPLILEDSVQSVHLHVSWAFTAKSKSSNTKGTFSPASLTKTFILWNASVNMLVVIC